MSPASVLESPSEPVRGRVALVALCCITMFWYAVHLGALGIMLVQVQRTYGFQSDISGRVFPANFSAFVVGVLACGYLSDRFGRKPVLLLGIAIYTAGLALFAASASFGVVLAACALLGVGAGAMETVASALAADLYPERQAFILNLVQVAFGVGAIAGPLAAYGLVAAAFDWHLFYGLVAAANAVMFAVLLALPAPATGAGGEAVDPRALLKALGNPVFAAICVAQALYVASEVSFFTWMPTYFRQALPGGTAWMGAVITVFWVAMTLGRYATGVVVHRVRVTRLVVCMAAGGAVSSALAVAWHSPGPTMVFVALAGLFFSGIFGLILAEVAERFPTIMGSAVGGAVASGGVGGAIGPWAVGVLAVTPLGWRGALQLPTVALTCVALLALWLGKGRGREERG